MTAPEPPDETDSVQATSPWRRPPPGWTLFDSPWAAERRDAVEADAESNGHVHGARADGAAVVAPERPTPAADAGDVASAPLPLAAADVWAAAAPPTPQDVGATDATPPEPTAPVVDDAAPASSPNTTAAPHEGAAPAPPVVSDLGGIASTVSLPEGEHADATVPNVEDAGAAVMVEPAPADGAASAASVDPASRDSAHHERPAVVVASAVGVQSVIEPPVEDPSSGATPAAPEQRRRGRHARRATPWTRVRQVVGLLVLACVLACVGIVVFALVQGTWSINPVLSGSMRPGVAVGGLVISERVPVDQLELRDVIVFQDPLAPSEQIVHRIVQISVAHNGERLFLTQGDANVTRDPWRLRIPGGTAYRMRWSVPLLGYVAVAYENHRGIALILAGLLLLAAAVVPALTARRRRRAKVPTS
jgi:signal peptidase I